MPYLRPDGKTQVTFEYEDGKPVRLSHVLISTQHHDGIDRDTVIRPDLIEHVIRPVVPAQFADDDYDVYVNPTGKFVVGGPHGDTGLTGRKIIVDTYGGMGRHGGGAFSGKDPSKVDRSAAYAARWVAKHVVASGAATRCEVQVAYAIGMAHPVSILVETFGTETVDPAQDRRRPSARCSTCGRRDRARPRPEAADLPQDRGVRSLRPPAAGVHLGARQPARRLQARRRRLMPASGDDVVARVVPDVTGLDKQFDYLVPGRVGRRRAPRLAGARPAARSARRRVGRRGRTPSTDVPADGCCRSPSGPGSARRPT